MVKSTRIVIFLFLLLFLSVPVQAGIYSWTDDSGVRYYTNTPPPESARDIRRLEEIPYDAAADRARMAEREEAREERQEAIRMLQQQQAAEERIREARAKAKAAMQKAEALEEELREMREREAEEDDDYRIIIHPGYSHPYARPGYSNGRRVLGINPPRHTLPDRDKSLPYPGWPYEYPPQEAGDRRKK